MQKRFGNGFDYVARALDLACRQTPGRGNFFVLKLELDSGLSKPELELLFERIPLDINRLLHGRWRRAWHLAPYWEPGEAGPLPVTDSVGFNEFLNMPLPPGNALAAACCGGEVCFKFSHLLFDGLGAEKFLALWICNEHGLWPHLAGLPDAGLMHWSGKFRAGRQVNRYLINVKRNADHVFTLPVMPEGALCCVCRTLDAAAVSADAEREAGPFMLGVYLASLAAFTLAQIRDRKGGSGRIFLPTSVDLRYSDPNRGLFFNQWSCLPLEFGCAEKSDRAAWIAAGKAAFAQAVTTRLPQAFSEANFLMRIVPLPLFRKLCATMFAGTAGSAMFSCLGESELPPEWEHRRIRNLVHIPAMPPVPGLGIFFSRFGNHLNLTVACRAGTLDDSAVEALAGAIACEVMK